MPGAVCTHRLLNQRRVMPARQTIGFGFFTHLRKQPTSFELDEQIIHGGNGIVAEGVQFLMQQRAQLLRVQAGTWRTHGQKMQYQTAFRK